MPYLDYIDLQYRFLISARKHLHDSSGVLVLEHVRENVLFSQITTTAESPCHFEVISTTFIYQTNSVIID